MAFPRTRVPLSPEDDMDDSQLPQPPRDLADQGVLARKVDLECVVGMASALPRRAPGPLMIPPFRELIKRA